MLSRYAKMIFLIGAVLLLGVRSSAATDFDTALAAAYANNPNLLAARAEQRATDELVPAALSGWRPTVAGVVDGGRGWVDTRKPIDQNDTAWPRDYGVTVAQPIFRGFRTVSATSRAENAVLAGRSRLVGVEQDVLLQAVRAYITVNRDEAVLELNRNNEKVLAAQLKATEDRFAVGVVTQTDVAQAQARLQGAIAQRIAAEGALTASRAVYRQVIGQEPDATAFPDSEPAIPASREEVVEQSQGTPQVVAARFDEKSTKDNIDVVFGEKLPEVSIEGSWERQEDSLSSGRSADVGTIMGRVTIPLYQAGGVDARVRESKQRYQRSKELVEAALRGAEQEAVSAWQALETADAQLLSFEEQVKATEIAAAGVKEEQAAGTRTILDVLDAEQEALDAKVNRVSAQADQLIARYRVLAAVGRLTAEDLKLDTPIYDPTEYYSEVRNKFLGTGPSVE